MCHCCGKYTLPAPQDGLSRHRGHWRLPDYHSVSLFQDHPCPLPTVSGWKLRTLVQTDLHSTQALEFLNKFLCSLNPYLYLQMGIIIPANLSGKWRLQGIKSVNSPAYCNIQILAAFLLLLFSFLPIINSSRSLPSAYTVLDPDPWLNMTMCRTGEFSQFILPPFFQHNTRTVTAATT